VTTIRPQTNKTVSNKQPTNKTLQNKQKQIINEENVIRAGWASGTAARHLNPAGLQKPAAISVGVRIMSSAKLNGFAEVNQSSEMDFSENVRELSRAKEVFGQVGSGHDEMEGHEVGTLVHQLSETPRREIEALVVKLVSLLKKLETDGIRIHLDIDEYTKLNERVMQLTTIVADSVGKLPDPPRN
jgi:hypothetical protein